MEKRLEIEHCCERKAECFSKGKSVLTHTHTGELSQPVSAVYSYSIIVLSPHFLFTGKRMFLMMQHVEISMNHAQTGTLDEMAAEINTTNQQKPPDQRPPTGNFKEF